MARYGPWLVLVWVPLLLPASLVPALLEQRWAPAALYVAIGVLYVSAVVRVRRTRRPSAGPGVPHVLLGLQAACTVAALLMADDIGSTFMLAPFLAVAAAVVGPPRHVPGLVSLAAVVTTGAALVAGWPPLMAGWLAVVTVATGLGTHVAQRLGETVAELDRTRRELADAAVAAERIRFSRDLHDLLGHTLSVIVVEAEAIRRLAASDPEGAAARGADIERLGRSALREVREAVAGYREGSLADELSRAAAALRAGGVHAEITPPHQRLDAATEALLGWVVREGVTNVLRHSGARTCRISVGVDAGRAWVTVLDDGRGAGGEVPDQEQGAGRGTGLGTGLGGLSERLRDRGGRLVTRPGGPGLDGPGLDGPGLDGPGLDGPGLDGVGFELRAEVPASSEGATGRVPARDLADDHEGRAQTVDRTATGPPR